MFHSFDGESVHSSAAQTHQAQHGRFIVVVGLEVGPHGARSHIAMDPWVGARIHDARLPCQKLPFNEKGMVGS